MVANKRQRVRARARARFTGESYQLALTEIRSLSPRGAPIPEASCPGQSFLEAQLLESIRGVRQADWPGDSRRFGITAVTPRADELIVQVPAAALPKLLWCITPSWLPDGPRSPNVDVEVCGIPGLRAHPHRRGVALSRPGLPGRIRILVAWRTWQKATAAAFEDLLRRGGVLASHTHPDQWHPAEIDFTETLEGLYAPSSQRYRESRFPSQVLRRLPGLCPPGVNWVDMWMSAAQGYQIQLEWAAGPRAEYFHTRLNLLDEEYGLNAGYPTAEWDALWKWPEEPPHSVVRIRCALQPQNLLALRPNTVLS